MPNKVKGTFDGASLPCKVWLQRNLAHEQTSQLNYFIIYRN